MAQRLAVYTIHEQSGEEANGRKEMKKRSAASGRNPHCDHYQAMNL